MPSVCGDTTLGLALFQTRVHFVQGITSFLGVFLGMEVSYSGLPLVGVPSCSFGSTVGVRLGVLVVT